MFVCRYCAHILHCYKVAPSAGIEPFLFVRSEKCIHYTSEGIEIQDSFAIPQTAAATRVERERTFLQKDYKVLLYLS